MRKYHISASLVYADFARLGEEAQSVINAGANILHLDAMENHFGVVLLRMMIYQ
jgi:ribulose-phosphate 3-epimerase